MNIKITGISGFLGHQISRELTKNGHAVSGIKRDLLYGPIDDLTKEIDGSDVIINLAGAPILQRWTKKNKTIIYNSRVETTRNLVNAINKLPSNKQPEKFISASAIGVYKTGELHDESSNQFDSGFVGKVVMDWEKQAESLPNNVQKIIFRIGLVLGRKAKTIQNLLLPFKLGLGGSIGNGKQAFPFVHESDVARAFLWAVEHYQNNSTFNLTAPEKITNKEFTQALAKILNRPAFLFIPRIIFKLLYGKASILITESPIVSSEKILASGFRFKYPDIKSALKQIIFG